MTKLAFTNYNAEAASGPATGPEPTRSSTSGDHLNPNMLLPALHGLGISPSLLRNRHAYSDDDDSDNEAAISASKKKKKFYIIITSDLLIPGDGEPIPNGALVVEAKTIVWVGTRDSIPEEYTSAPHKTHAVPYMMPGLWDVHMHVVSSGGKEAAARAYGPFGEHTATQGARLARGLWIALQQGYTSLRDLGGFGCEVAVPIEEGVIVGPNIYAAGAFISQTAGHGDQFNMPPGDALLRFGVNNIQPGFFCEGWGVMADGVDECRRAVRLQVRRGAKCIKILATGGVMSLDDNPNDAQFCKDEMDALVEEATRMGRAVASHCHAKEGILASIRAGVTTIEHGSYADDECLDLMKEHNIILVPTHFIGLLLIKVGKGIFPKKVYEKLKMVAEGHAKVYKRAIEKGVTIALGSDAHPETLQGDEIVTAVEIGMSNLEAIKAATATAPLVLGKQAPKSGQLKVGYDADILGLLGNPAEDIEVLRDGEKIKWVWKGGKLFKGPGVGPWGEE